MSQTDILEKCYKDIARAMSEKVSPGWSTAWIEASFGDDVESFIARQYKVNDPKLYSLPVDFNDNILEQALLTIFKIVVDNDGNHCKWFEFKLTPDGSFNLNFDYDNSHAFSGR